MRWIQWVFITGLLTSCASSKPPSLPALDVAIPRGPTSVPFVKHEESGPFKSYLAMNLPYEGFAKIRESVEAKEQIKLINRGEAHITVVTPPEYDKILSKKISIKEIHKIAEEMKIQETPYKILCVGKGFAQVDKQKETTYFVVVSADRLFEIRKAIQKAYVAKGGKESAFDVENFYPHVTLGYTKRDLHAEDGVTKDASSCAYTLQQN